MALKRLEIQEKKLDQLFDEVSKYKEEDIIKSHLAKYLCIQASGYLENVIKELIEEYHNKTCTKQTSNYVNKKLESFTNIHDKKLTNFLKSFDTEWYNKFNLKLTDEQKESLNSIISQRHLIAHGNEQRSNLKFSSMIKYYQDLKEIVKLLRTIIKK
jgi:hypothetical protein